ncbi:type VI secretion system baseplate subunit TssG [Burkholderia cepacia]|uniref:type VI secretion system baseplate subunit TssG n=1 Tax=Burkholderia cepacia TaxID=292 RepID=UPI001CF5E111|nr:type VI secretion system baseplate subunit TssG [Burkholderia cepacia]MCA7993976.1 type VI secretion system baseplate subunit TssG [Burkholderia cepacia]
MAIADRQATPDLAVADAVLASAKAYDFFRLLEQLHALHDDDLEASDPLGDAHWRIRLSSSAGLAFPASDISFAARMPDSSASDYQVQVNFFGLHGTDSPLPGYYLDRLAYEYGQGIGIRPAFLDFFHHRLLTLLHRAWRKYRYHIRFRSEASDGFSRYVFALVGLGDGDLRGVTPLPWSRLLSFAGSIINRSRSASMVAGIVADCFGLKSVQVREFEIRYVDIPSGQRLSLGKRNGEVGDSFVIGKRVRICHNKFTVVISDLDQERFRHFLPSGEDFARLRKLMEFLLRDPMAFDLELRLRPAEVESFNLSRERGSHLGWTTFVNGDDATRTPVRIKVRL